MVFHSFSDTWSPAIKLRLKRSNRQSESESPMERDQLKWPEMTFWGPFFIDFQCFSNDLKIILVWFPMIFVWFPIISNDSLWCPMISYDYQLLSNGLLMICSAGPWFPMISHDVLMISHDFQWFPMISNASRRFPWVSDDFIWFPECYW